MSKFFVDFVAFLLAHLPAPRRYSGPFELSNSCQLSEK